jgi:hypothetical protein
MSSFCAKGRFSSGDTAMPSMKLIPTEVATPLASPPPASRRKVRPVAVAGSFQALPVQLSSSKVAGVSSIQQWIYVRKREDDQDPEAAASSQSQAGCTVFAVNLPSGSSEDEVKQGFQDLLKARLETASLRDNAKGKGREVDLASVVGCKLVQNPVKRPVTLLEAEGIAKSQVLVGRDETHSTINTKGNKKGKKEAETASKLEENPIHPLFISDDIDVQTAVEHLYPSTSTLKAHVTFSSAKAVSILLNPSSSWRITAWPDTSAVGHNDHDASFISLGGSASSAKKQPRHRTTDEILYDLSRPSLASVKLHVDDWMRAFDAKDPAAVAAKARSSAAAAAEEPKSKRAQNREALARATAKADMERKKAIKKRRLYDDDYAAPEVDADGWTTVARGGRYGRSAAEEAGGDSEMIFEDEEEINRAQLEGFASGKRSVGVASKNFAKELEEEREIAVARLNAELGIGPPVPPKQPSNVAGGDESRGTSRGQKKKKSGGVEVGMYGFQRKQENKKRGLRVFLL